MGFLCCFGGRDAQAKHGVSSATSCDSRDDEFDTIQPPKASTKATKNSAYSRDTYCTSSDGGGTSQPASDNTRNNSLDVPAGNTPEELLRLCSPSELTSA